MSEKKENNDLIQSNSEKNTSKQNLMDNNSSSSRLNKKDYSSYSFKNGNKLVLSGINLKTPENQELLKNIISTHKTSIELDLSNCNLNTFPEIIYKLKHLSILDLRNNDFQNFEELVQKLVHLNNLTDLKIDLVDQNQVLLILSSIPRLIFLNGKSTKEAITIVDVDEKDVEDISLQNDLQIYNEIVNKINMKEKDQNFVNDFQNKLYEEAEKVKSCLYNNAPNYIYANVVIQSQFELQKILSKKFLKFLDDSNKEIGEILFNTIFKSGERLVELMNNLYPRIEEKTDGLRTQLEEAWKSAEDIGNFENKFNEMKKLKDIMAGENEIIKIKMNKLENENKVMMDKLCFLGLYGSKNISSDNFNNNNQLISKNNSNNNFNENNNNESKHLINIESKIFLENENNENNTNEQIEQNDQENNNNYNNSNLIKNKSDTNLITPKILSIKNTKDIIQEIYNSKTIYDQKCYENKIPRETLEQYMYTYLNQKYGLKNLTIEWASSIINAIKMYSSEDCDINLFGKILRNEQEEDSRLVIENLKNNVSELLEFYLRNKNPFKRKNDIKKLLKSKKEGILIEEEWKGIINYIYNEEDAEIMINKIINFIKKQNEKRFIPLNMYAQTGMGPTEIFNLTSDSMKNNNNNILQNLSTFNQNSSNLNPSNSMNYLFPNHGNNRKLSREEIFNITKLNEEMNISYKDFLRLLCVYQIKNRDKYLKNFVKLFRQHDTDLDGILNESEFSNLIKDIPYCKDNADDYIFKFLSIIDPFNNKKITFSECISILSMEIVEENFDENDTKGKNINENNKDKKGKMKKNRNQISLLDKICYEN